MGFFRATTTTTTTTTVVEDIKIETDNEELKPRMGFFAALWGGGGHKDVRMIQNDSAPNEARYDDTGCQY